MFLHAEHERRERILMAEFNVPSAVKQNGTSENKTASD
jgi:hypothetical protein